MGSAAMIALYVTTGAAALFGLIIGLSYRVPAVVAASVAIVVALPLASMASGFSAGATAIFTLCALCALQGSYLVGACTSYVMFGVAKRRASPASVMDDRRSQPKRTRYALSL